MPVILVYGGSEIRSIQSYLVMRGSIDWDVLAEKIDWPKKESYKIVRKQTQEKIGHLLKPALQYATTCRDRHVIKLMFTKLTSINFSGHFGVNITVANMDVHQVRLDSGNMTSYRLNKAKQQQTGRLPGSGRPFKCEQYPFLIAVHVFLI